MELLLCKQGYLISDNLVDNGREYQGTSKHLFVKTCHSHRINQKFTKPTCPQTNGKAERVIRTLNCDVA
ncbi:MULTISPECIES: DDE-type integrase/transposase/recombinase [unclassified Gilliamella]|uniref:DDE-type integrase/transposase/recombinase n=1 Tax=unclassified Gilliamella TaxID=2685620 RepID=UPI0011467598|nr:DDE-type integrase/transposase/recombinase [Gilliamella apicola]